MLYITVNLRQAGLNFIIEASPSLLRLFNIPEPGV